MSLDRAALAVCNRLAKTMQRIDDAQGTRLLDGLRAVETQEGFLAFLAGCHPDVSALVDEAFRAAVAQEDWRRFKARILVFTRPAKDAPHTKR